MSTELVPWSHELILQKQSVSDIVRCNERTARFGLVLTEQQALELVETRSHALKDTGRIEFGGGVIDQIINQFYDSPYLSRHDYEQTLHALVEMFYFFKNETLNLISDEDLIRFMRKSYDGVCQGSLDLLAGRELERLARDLRYGTDGDEPEDEADGDEYEDN